MTPMTTDIHREKSEPMKHARDKRLKAASEPLESRRLPTTAVGGITCGASDGGANVTSVEVYNDLNDNGTLDSGEPNAYTFADGHDENRSARFEIDASAGDHIRLVVPSTMIQLYPADNGYATVSSDTVEDDSWYDSSGIGDFESEGFTMRATNSVNGTIYDDANGNGTLNLGESTESGWTVFDDVNHNGTLDSGEASATTDGSGDYSLNAALYDTLGVIVPSGYAVAARPSAVSTACGGYNFRVHGPITINGSVYNDTGDDGSVSGDSTITGTSSWVVYDDQNFNGQSDAGEPTATVASNGTYSLTTLETASCHAIRIDAPSGWRVSAPSDGLAVVYESGTHCGTTWSGVNFGVTQKGMISGRVFEDLNNDDFHQAGETVLTGRTITVTDPSNNSVHATTTTDSTGYYKFNDLPTGQSWKITGTLSSPSGWIDGSATQTVTVGAGDSLLVNLTSLRRLNGPTVLGAAASGTQVVLTWNDNAAGAETGTKIYRSVNGGTFSVLHTSTTANDTTYTDTGLSSMNDYQYKVTVYDGNGESAPSNLADAAAPSDPINFTAGAEIGDVTIEWAPGGNAPSGTTYNIYRDIDPSFPSPDLVASGLTGTTYTDTSSVTSIRGKKLYYQMTATHVSGAASSSSGGTGSLAPIIPEAPRTITWYQSVFLSEAVPLAGSHTASISFGLTPHVSGKSGSTATGATFNYFDSALLMGGNLFNGEADGYFEWNGGQFDSFNLTTSTSGVPVAAHTLASSTSVTTTGTQTFHEYVHISNMVSASLIASLSGIYAITYTY